MRNLLLAAIAVGALSAAPQQADKSAASSTSPAVTANQALIKRYCATCHNEKLRTAKLALDVLDLTHPEKDALTWERVVRKLRGGMMPPPGAPRPPLEAVNAFAGYLEDSLDKAALENPNP